MTPKEKAFELTERIRKAQGSSKLYAVDKATALICVDEIISTCPQKENEIFGISKGLTYWQQVRNEIENYKS